MSNPFFDHPILNSPYEPPTRHWELDGQGQPTHKILETRRRPAHRPWMVAENRRAITG